MRAAVYRGPGDVRVESVAEATLGDPGDVVLEVVRAAICGTDAAEWSHGPVLALPPVTLGHEFVGRVVDAGPGAVGVETGMRVVSGAGISCGACDQCLRGRTNLCSSYLTIGLHRDGGLAELVATPAAICFPVPAGCSDDAAAMAQPLAVALHAVRRGGLARGSSCVVIGAGGIGAFVVAASAALGAAPLIAIDVDDHRLAQARALGANRVIDARSEDAFALVQELTAGEGADVVIEASGAPESPATAVTVARRGGRVVLVGLHALPRELDLLSVSVRELEVVGTLAHVCAVDLPEALELLARTDLAETVLDRIIPLSSIVEEGLRPLAEGAAKGKIVVDTTG